MLALASVVATLSETRVWQSNVKRSGGNTRGPMNVFTAFERTSSGALMRQLSLKPPLQLTMEIA